MVIVLFVVIVSVILNDIDYIKNECSSSFSMPAGSMAAFRLKASMSAVSRKTEVFPRAPVNRNGLGGRRLKGLRVDFDMDLYGFIMMIYMDL